MDQHPSPNKHINLNGKTSTTVLTYDPLLMGSVQPVPPPPSIKPSPPTAPPPPNSTVYNAKKDINKFTNNYSPAHNHLYETDKTHLDDDDDDDDDEDDNDNNDNLNTNNNNKDRMIDYGESVWNNNKYKMYEYNKFDPLTGHYSIDNDNNNNNNINHLEPPTKKRRLNENERINNNTNNNNNSDRYSLLSLGFQPLAARAIIERLDCSPKLRYSEEFHRDITNAMQFETNMITKKLTNDNNINDRISIQNIYPTSNGKNRDYLYTECGINPNDKTSINKLKGHLLSKSISTMIFTKQKQAIDTKIHKFKLHRKETEILEKAKQKSLEIARKLGFVPEFLRKTENEDIKINSDDEYDHEDGEIKETDAASKKLKKLQTNNTASIVMNNDSINLKEIERAKQLLNGGIMPPPIQKQSAFTRFECKSILKSDGSEYDKVLGSKLNGIKKYDSNFRPMFPITNKEYRFSVVSNYGYKLLQKYGYKKGDGLGRNNQGVTTFPRLIGQNTFKGINYSQRNRKNLNIGFIHCMCCDKSFSGYINLKNHIISKKHQKNLSIKPNNLVLLCVQCQLQFPTAQKIKEHYMLVQHDDTIPGISAFQKQLREELLKNQLKYIQNLKTSKTNPFRSDSSSSPPPTTRATVEPPIIQNNNNNNNNNNNEQQIEQISYPPPPQPLPLPFTKQAFPAYPYQQHIQSMQAHYHSFVNHAYSMVAPPPTALVQNASNITSIHHHHHHHVERAPIDIGIDRNICQDIKHKIYRLGLKLPIAVPTVPWIYCPSCKSFFTTFSKFNNHYNTQRHIISINQLNQDDKNKMFQLFQYIKEKQQQHLTNLQT